MRATTRTWTLRAAAVFAALFGALTIRSGGEVLFGGPEAAAAAGNAVPFVLWFNFLAGFAYVAVAAGLWFAARWSRWGSLAIAGATAAVFVAFALHAASGEPFEMRTVWAMTLRTLAWAAIAALAWRALAASRGR